MCAHIFVSSFWTFTDYNTTSRLHCEIHGHVVLVCCFPGACVSSKGKQTCFWHYVWNTTHKSEWGISQFHALSIQISFNSSASDSDLTHIHFYTCVNSEIFMKLLLITPLESKGGIRTVGSRSISILLCLDVVFIVNLGALCLADINSSSEQGDTYWKKKVWFQKSLADKIILDCRLQQEPGTLPKEPLNEDSCYNIRIY